VAEAVLDASALLAFLRNEPGAGEVAAVLRLSFISAAGDLADVVRRYSCHEAMAMGGGGKAAKRRGRTESVASGGQG
jgi:PIN domain nuclease of toxin-antitoxin system